MSICLIHFIMVKSVHTWRSYFISLISLSVFVYLFIFLFCLFCGSTLGAADTAGYIGKPGVEAGNALGGEMVFYQQQQRQSRAEKRGSMKCVFAVQMLEINLLKCGPCLENGLFHCWVRLTDLVHLWPFVSWTWIWILKKKLPFLSFFLFLTNGHNNCLAGSCKYAALVFKDKLIRCWQMLLPA